jgi:hypothetical protein
VQEQGVLVSLVYGVLSNGITSSHVALAHVTVRWHRISSVSWEAVMGLSRWAATYSGVTAAKYTEHCLERIYTDWIGPLNLYWAFEVPSL